MNSATSNLFMVSSDRNVSPSRASTRVYPLILTAIFEQGNAGIEVSRLIRAAEICYGKRDYPALEQVAQMLAATSSGQDAGLYYLAILERSKGNIEQARLMLDPLVRFASPVIKARASQFFALSHYRQGDVSQARQGYLEAIRAAKDIDWLSICFALQELSILSSEAGDHYGALDDLQKAWPLTRSLAPSHPFLFYVWHNDLAFELAQIGRIDKAREHSAIACNSPLISAYPEWLETSREIEAIQQARASAPVVVVVQRPNPKRKTAAPAIIAVWLDIAPRPRNRLAAFKSPRVCAPIRGLILYQVKYSIWPLAPPSVSRP